MERSHQPRRIKMGLRIATNVASISAQRTLEQTNTDKASSMSKLSSGTRITKAADDAAGLAISEKLKAQIRGLRQADRNTNDGISMIQIAEGGLNEVSNVLIRLRELAVQSASDTIGDTERGFTDMEYQNLKSEIQRIAEVTEFNGKKLLNGAEDKYDFQVGVNNDAFQDRISYNADSANATLSKLGISELAIMDQEGARGSLNTIDKAIETVSGQRATLGAVQNRLVSTSTNLKVTGENLSAANSRIRDVDYASEVSKQTKLGILAQAGVSVLGQANMAPQSALKLIG